MDDKKIIPFPVDKVRKSPGRVSQNEKMPGDRRRVMIVLSLASVFVLSSIWLENMNSRKSGDRMPANSIVGSSRNIEEEISLARKIMRESVREPASQGRKPNLEDKLRIGSLAGRYSVNFDKGALVEIQYKGLPGDEPVYLEPREKFLREHKELFRIPFNDIVHSETVTDDNGKTEVYELVGDGKETQATVRFRFDKPERFHSMKVESRKRALSSE